MTQVWCSDNRSTDNRGCTEEGKWNVVKEAYKTSQGRKEKTSLGSISQHLVSMVIERP